MTLRCDFARPLEATDEVDFETWQQAYLDPATLVPG